MPVMVRFSTADAAWLAPIESVLGVQTIDSVRPVPDPAGGIVGILDRDGATYPVTDILGNEGTHVLVLSDADRVVGVLAQSVRDVTEIPADALGPRPRGQNRPYIAATVGSGRDLAFVLDSAAVLEATVRAEVDHA